MLKNYFKIALRSLLKNKVFTFINILGLAIGIAACLLILQYVQQELSYDDFHVNKENLYRVKQNRYNKGVLTTEWAAGCGAAGYELKEGFAEVEAYATLRPTDGVVIYKQAPNGPVSFKEEKIFFATASFLPMFSFDLLDGDEETALVEPYKAVISASAAQRYFGAEDPLGKRISVNDEHEYEISGVFRDIPENSHLKFDFLFSYSTFTGWAGEEVVTAWQWDGFYTYLQLKDGTDPKALEEKFPALIQAKAGEDLVEYDADMKFILQPLTDIHLYSNFMMEAEVNGDGEAVYALLIISIFIIIIAWVNYINLATAKSVDRAKEVGIRKVMGSQRTQLIRQFMAESVLLNILSVIIAILLVLLSYRYFSSLIGQELTLSIFSSASFWWFLSGIFVIGAFFSGVYPAFVLSAFKPVQVLKGKMSTSKNGVLLRKTLVILQFAASVFLIAGTLVVYQQIMYMQDQELGVAIDQTLVIEAPSVVDDSVYAERVESFKAALTANSSIKAATASTTVPGNKPGWNAGGIRLLSEDDSESNQYRVIGIDYDFLEAFQLETVAGRNFSRDFGTDEGAVLFNESAVKLIGFNEAEAALSEEIFFWGDTFKIVGVVKDYHQESLKADFDPLIFRLIPASRSFFSLKVETAKLSEIIATTHAVWDNYFPGNPFSYFFLDDHFNQQYEADLRFGQTFGFFALLAIFVACLGLFGLSSFMAVQKTKEIGIRKVLGSSVTGIVALLSKDFVRLVMIASLLSLPLVYFVMQSWLDDYAFRIEIAWWLLLSPVIIVLFIALFTISFQTIRAALADPAKSLRYE
ncbi:putative ABC transport system permease protein [Catalinimonas alkaloidigena]|uniref:ABC transporter permease n=1 Tax=Catalinimonas alkaloidigena TaxID=1075417 RepID=UPI0024056B2A|nr:ABC transporter permease [Catalinimonas alkaloidigena]MDF9796065.1 putative ABC transport system permease protein [Catalinimonas alkaloidigena]